MEKTDNNLKEKKKEREIRKKKGREKEFNSYLFVPFLLVCCDIIKVLKIFKARSRCDTIITPTDV